MSAKARVWFSVTRQGKPKFVQTQRKHIKDVLIHIYRNIGSDESCVEGGTFIDIRTIWPAQNS